MRDNQCSREDRARGATRLVPRGRSRRSLSLRLRDRRFVFAQQRRAGAGGADARPRLG